MPVPLEVAQTLMVAGVMSCCHRAGVRHSRGGTLRENGEEGNYAGSEVDSNRCMAALEVLRDHVPVEDRSSVEVPWGRPTLDSTWRNPAEDAERGC